MRMFCVLGGLFYGHCSPVVARTSPQTRKNCSVAELSFGMHNVRIHHILCKLCMMEEERKKEDAVIDISRFIFITLREVSGTQRVDLAIE